MTRHTAPVTLTVAIVAALLAGCAAGTTPGGEASSGAPTSESAPVASEVSCDDVAVAVADYIDGLVPRDDNESDDYGALCGWEAPEGTTDLAAIRSVEVLVSFESSDGLSADDLTAAGLTPLPDAAIDAAGGIAYTTSVDATAAAVIVTTVAMPEVEVVVTGGQWAGYPALDGPAAIGVARSILGLS